MPEPILNPAYWRKRIQYARQLHHSVFICDEARWQRIEAQHRTILKQHIKPTDSVLDAGCAYGRLLTLMPDTWHGTYLGIDISPDFVAMARQKHSDRMFEVADLRDLSTYKSSAFDWAVLISVRPMVARNLGLHVWVAMQTQLMRIAKCLLFLEYDETSKGDCTCSESSEPPPISTETEGNC